MLQVYYAIGGWDLVESEPIGGFVKVDGPVETVKESVEVMVLYAGVMARRHGPGEMVVIDVEATRFNEENCRIDPYKAAAAEAVALVA